MSFFKMSNLTMGGVLRKVYPVGAIYISTISTSPATLFGFGTWEQIQDRFLLAAGSTYTAGATGGEANHTLTVDEMPSHSHRISNVTSTTVGGHGHNSNQGYLATASTNSVIGNGYYADTNNTGGSQPHNNMPPYLTVYVWKRTA